MFHNIKLSIEITGQNSVSLYEMKIEYELV